MRHFGQTHFSEVMSYRKRRKREKQEEKNAEREQEEKNASQDAGDEEGHVTYSVGSSASELDGSVDMTKDPFIKISPVDLRYFPRIEGQDEQDDKDAPEAFFVYCPDHKSVLSSKVLFHVSIVMYLSLVSRMCLSARVSLLSVSSLSLHSVSV
jgi:hypothetical protein